MRNQLSTVRQLTAFLGPTFIPVHWNTEQDDLFAITLPRFLDSFVLSENYDIFPSVIYLVE